MAKIIKLTPDILKKIIAEEKLKIESQLKAENQRKNNNSLKRIAKLNEAQVRLIKKYKLFNKVKKILKEKLKRS